MEHSLIRILCEIQRMSIVELFFDCDVKGHARFSGFISTYLQQTLTNTNAKSLCSHLIATALVLLEHN
jgi:hypothetical protein